MAAGEEEVVDVNVMAAPNRSRIRARVDAVEPVEDQPKCYFTVDVLEARAESGGLFVRQGDSARMFVVGDEPGLRAGDVFEAEVEYLGGPQGGQLQLHEVLQVEPPERDSPPAGGRGPTQE
ncbi:hypothetical protein [Ornithinimicrobium kibberense]|uniref:Uncharacterized protein n=2 Tax=Ornithinimicrobium kibberense TaxID=282060 RepID=A0ABV5V663_9MICO|nr:hypothetical protein [Ornithinimicrobium kibberense]